MKLREVLLGGVNDSLELFARAIISAKSKPYAKIIIHN